MQTIMNCVPVPPILSGILHGSASDLYQGCSSGGGGARKEESKLTPVKIELSTKQTSPVNIDHVSKT